MELRTLVIDDSNIQRLVTTMMVKEHEGLKLVGDYVDPLEGIKGAITREADLIIMDVLYKDRTAFDLLDQIAGNVGVILISSWAEYASRAYAYPMMEFLLKPVRWSSFCEAVEHLSQLRARGQRPVGIAN